MEETSSPAAPGSEQTASARTAGFIIGPDDPILITGAGGFIAPKLIERLLDFGYRNLICVVRPSSKMAQLDEIVRRRGTEASIAIVRGNLLSREDCAQMARGVAVVYHLAAGRGEKSYPDAYLNSVVTTRNLIEACATDGHVKRFVNVSSFAVYSNRDHARLGLLDENCPVVENPADRGEAYCFAKVRQDQMVEESCGRHRIPYTIVRPGYVYGPGNPAIPGRVGIGSFGIFLHLGGPNRIPLAYVDNCAEAIALAGVKPGVDGEIFNIVDDDLPTSRKFLRLYKRRVRSFHSLYLPHAVSYALCFLWEKYSAWSEGQLIPAYNRNKWYAYWKKTRYSNEKAKKLLGWSPRVPASEAYQRYFDGCRAAGAQRA